MAAAKCSDISFIVLMAASGLTGEDVLYLNGEYIRRASGISEEQVRAKRAVQEQLFAVLKEEKDSAVAEKKLSKH